MNYDQFVTDKSVAVGVHFLDIIADVDQSISGFYLDIADAPNSLIPSDLTGPNQLVPYNPPAGTAKSRDKVEEIYSKSFTFGWIPLTTVRTLTGFEMYIDLTRLPLDFFALAESTKYQRWFLGYKNTLNGTIYACVYGHNTRDMIKIGVKNTINFDINYVCEIDNITTPENLYINDLEHDTKDLGQIKSEYYRLGELDDKFRNSETTTQSYNVGTIIKGKLKFKNQ